MIIVTGAAGFIGSNLLNGLNQAGHCDIVAVDDLTDGHKYVNLAKSEFSDYVHYEDFLDQLEADVYPAKKIEAIFHQGACSTTTEWDGKYVMKTNFDYSKRLFHFAIKHQIPFIYASSAAVYGGKHDFIESDQQQMPLNVYGYSKWLFDQYVLRHLPKIKSTVAGLRYFNVYGPGEQHKQTMASVAFHMMNQLRDTGKVRLFSEYDGYKAGEQSRDFVYVDDVVKLNLWCWQKKIPNGIYNCGTGHARQFNELARILIDTHGSGEVEYIPFPNHLKAAYQSYTCANPTKLQSVGYNETWISLEDGVAAYYKIANPAT
jgi:ADP-L-glycero-D-manno-heptose 6-epimerase